MVRFVVGQLAECLEHLALQVRAVWRRAAQVNFDGVLEVPVQRFGVEGRGVKREHVVLAVEAVEKRVPAPSDVP